MPASTQREGNHTGSMTGAGPLDGSREEPPTNCDRPRSLRSRRVSDLSRGAVLDVCGEWAHVVGGVRGESAQQGVAQGVEVISA